ncbi:MAG: shikimate kinase [Hyphomicrobiales bacterium]|nr:shikimate kinase [Hyphomicrobiales bacterium]
MATDPQTLDEHDVDRIRAHLRGRNIVLIGMMGAGKTSVGRRLATELDLPFVDADAEIEQAANLTIAEIFETYGEDHFRDGERKVIARLLADGPKVIATGGGAFMNDETRAEIGRRAISIWLKACLPLLMERVQRKANRPLLSEADPKSVMKRLLTAREPVYATADITIASKDVPHSVVVGNALKALDNFLLCGNAK